MQSAFREPCPACAHPADNIACCRSCGHLFPPAEVDLFALLGITPTFNVSHRTIEDAYENLMMQFHPDFFETASADQKNRSLQWSAIAKTARDTLLHPRKRALYICRKKFADEAFEGSQPPGEFVMEMFELNERLSEAGDDALELFNRSRLQCEAFEAEAEAFFEKLLTADKPEQYLAEAGRLLGEFKFWMNIRDLLNQSTRD